MRARPHGGDLDRAEAVHGRPADGWLDLSTGINPWPYPVPDVAADAWARLPAKAALDDLLAAARRAYGVDPAAGVIAAPGTQALIQLVPRLVPAGEVRVVGPTYGEHAPAWAGIGHRVADVADLADLPDGLAGVVVCNPNNPDGRVVPRDVLLDLAGRLAAAGGLLLVDEAFADVTPETSLADAAGRPGLAVLRSFGKFFGLAGLRLGFALAAPETAERLATLLGPWAVSGPALAIGRRALLDEAWIMATRQRLAAEAEALRSLLVDAGLEYVGGTDLFQLARCPDADALQRRLAARGVWIRVFPGRPGLARFGLPGGEVAQARLARALAEDNR